MSFLSPNIFSECELIFSFSAYRHIFYLHVSGDVVSWFCWNRVHFIHSSQYEVVFWICVGNRVDNAGMFPAKQCLHSVEAFSAPYPTPPVRGWDYKELEENRARIGDPNY